MFSPKYRRCCVGGRHSFFTGQAWGSGDDREPASQPTLGTFQVVPAALKASSPHHGGFLPGLNREVGRDTTFVRDLSQPGGMRYPVAREPPGSGARGNGRRSRQGMGQNHDAIDIARQRGALIALQRVSSPGEIIRESLGFSRHTTAHPWGFPQLFNRVPRPCPSAVSLGVSREGAGPGGVVACASATGWGC